MTTMNNSAGAVSIVDVLASAISRVQALPALEAESRFPVVVTGETRAYLEAQAKVLGTSLAGLCGTILNEVAAESARRSMESPGPVPVSCAQALAAHESFAP